MLRAFSDTEVLNYKDIGIKDHQVLLSASGENNIQFQRRVSSIRRPLRQDTGVGSPEIV